MIRKVDRKIRLGFLISIFPFFIPLSSLAMEDNENIPKVSRKALLAQEKCEPTYGYCPPTSVFEFENGQGELYEVQSPRRETQILKAVPDIFKQARNPYERDLESLSDADLNIAQYVGDPHNKEKWLQSLRILLGVFEEDEKALNEWEFYILTGDESKENSALKLKNFSLDEKSAFLCQYFRLHRPQNTAPFSELEKLLRLRKVDPYFLCPESFHVTDEETFDFSQMKNSDYLCLMNFYSRKEDTLNWAIQSEVITPLFKVIQILGKESHHPSLKCLKDLPITLDLYDQIFPDIVANKPEVIEGLVMSLECLQVKKKRLNDAVINLLKPLRLFFSPKYDWRALEALEERNPRFLLLESPQQEPPPHPMRSQFMFFNALRRIGEIGESLKSFTPGKLEGLFPNGVSPGNLRDQLAHSGKIIDFFDEDKINLYGLIAVDLLNILPEIHKYLYIKYSAWDWEGFKALNEVLAVSPRKKSYPNDLLDKHLKQIFKKTYPKNLELIYQLERRNQFITDLKCLIQLMSKLDKYEILLRSQLPPTTLYFLMTRQAHQDDFQSYRRSLEKLCPSTMDQTVFLDEIKKSTLIEKEKEIASANADQKKQLRTDYNESIRLFVNKILNIEIPDEKLEVARESVIKKRQDLREFCQNSSPSGGFLNMKMCYEDFSLSFNTLFNLSNQKSSFDWKVPPRLGKEKLFHELHGIPCDLKEKLVFNSQRIYTYIKFIEKIRYLFHVQETFESLNRKNYEKLSYPRGEALRMAFDTKNVLENYRKSSHLNSIQEFLKKLFKDEPDSRGALEFLIASSYERLKALADCSLIMNRVSEAGKQVRDFLFHGLSSDENEYFAVTGEGFFDASLYSHPDDITAHEGAILMINVFYLLQYELKKFNGV